jgi:hypothetical protein
MYDRVAARWTKLGLPGEPPVLRSFEEEAVVAYHESVEIPQPGRPGARREDDPGNQFSM